MLTLRKFTEFLLPKVLSIDPFTAMAIGTGAAGALNFLGAKESGEATERAAQTSAGAQKEMFDISRSDMLPFLQAATSTGTYAATPRRGSFGPGSLTPGEQVSPPGALTRYIEGVDQAPGAPEILGTPIFQRFDPRFDEYGQRFKGDRFSYDPNEAMESPDIKFIQEQGEKALMRNLAGRRQLGSGQRLTEAIKFGQGLSSQALNDYFNRKRIMDEINYGRGQGESEMAYSRGLIERGIDIENVDRDRDRILSNRDRAQRELLDRYALDKGIYEDRMSKLGNIINIGSGAGAITSSGAQQTGANLANIYQGLGRDQAAATMGKFGAIGDTIGDAAMLYGMHRGGYFDKPPTQTVPYYVARP